MFESWSTDTVQFLIIAGLISVVGGLLINSWTILNKKVDRIESKLDSYEITNQADHAKVDASLARIEEAFKGIDKDLDRHEKRLDDIDERDE